MSDESAFTGALRINPADRVTRLVYADWLAERDRFVDEAAARVCADPGDDGPRLAFADACERAGDKERAEFVRVQVELERIRPDADPKKGVFYDRKRGGLNYTTPAAYPRWKELDCRERELWWANGCRWMPTLPGVTQNDVRDEHHAHNARSGSLYGSGREQDPGRIDLDYRRGFLHTVTCSAADWLAHADELLLRHPVGRVRLTTPINRDMYRVWTGRVSMASFCKRRDQVPLGHKDDVASKLLATTWPTIAFDLPHTVGRVHVHLRLAGPPPGDGRPHA